MSTYVGVPVQIAGAAPTTYVGVPIQWIDGTGAVLVPVSNPYTAPNSNAPATSGITFTTGNAVSGNNNGGDFTINLGNNTGTGRDGSFIVNAGPGSPFSTAGWVQFNAVVTGNGIQAGHSVISSITMTGLTADYTGLTCSLDGVFNTDTSAFNYTGKPRGTMGHVFINGSGTVAYPEGVAGVVQVNAGATGTLSSGYGTGGELIVSATGAHTTTLFSGVLGQIENLAAGIISTAYGVEGSVYDDSGLGTTGTFGLVAGVYGHVIIYKASTTTAYGIFGQVQGANTGPITTGAALRGVLRVDAGSVIATGYGLLIDSPTVNSTGAVTNIRGIRVSNQGNANFTSAFGVFIADQSGATGAKAALCLGSFSSGTAQWGLFQGTAINNSLLGNLAIGSNTAASGTGALAIEGLISRYQAVATAGWGVPAIYAAGRPATQTNTTVVLATYTVGAADGSFEVSANINVTVSTTVTMTVTCTYTDEANVARTLQLQFSLLGGTWASSITTAQGNIPYESPVYHIRAKAATTISVQTAGTVTAVTYTGEAIIKQMR